MSAYRQRLLEAADNCEEMARQCGDSDTRGSFHALATGARQFARTPCMTNDGFRLALESIKAQVAFLTYMSGDVPLVHADRAESVCTAAASHAYTSPLCEPPAVNEGVLREQMLNPRQLGAMFGLSENGAREAIKRGYRRRLIGFQRDGALWLAEPGAFMALRSGCGIGEGNVPPATTSP